MAKMKYVMALLMLVTIVVSGYSMVSDDSLKANGNSKDKNDNSGSVWDIVKEQGLQGEHYNLLLDVKKDEFNKQDCTNSVGNYSNKIFLSADSAADNQIIMSSGNAKGKWASTVDTTYGVRDSCVSAFDGDEAELTIPPNENGYLVVAKTIGKPTENPEATISGDLVMVQDELGNDLMVLGLVTDDGFETPTTTLTRTKGKSSGVDITGLFEWSGSVCYLNTTNYCYDSNGVYTCTNQSICCADTDGDGMYNECSASLFDLNTSTSYCDAGLNLENVGCQTYDDEWVFGIGDYVEYMWGVDADKDFKVQIRFYPISG